MADRRGDAMRQQPFAPAHERVFDGGGSSGPGPAFGSYFDHGSYMSLHGTGVIVNPQPPPPPWAVEEFTVAPVINQLTPQFSMANYTQSSYAYQQPASLVSPLAAGGNLHPYPSYLHADPPQQWPPREMTSSSSLPPPTFAILPAAPPHEQHMQLLRAAALGGSQAAIEQPAKDGYNWRKYGQKQLKDAESPRSYYKCTRDGCPVKKIVERSSDGCIKEITYKGRHSHPRLREPPRGHGAGTTCGADDAGAEEDEDEPSDEDTLHEDDGQEGHDRDAGGEAAGQRVVKKPKITIQTPSEVDLLDDGYRWRKYGQKVVKGNPRPRSYYKCTADNCNVRKQIERSSADPECVLTTYSGRHSHDAPGRGADAAAAGSSSANLMMPSTMNSAGGTFQQSSDTRRLKEEDQD